jgi:serine/threonine protein kinase
VGNFNSK